MSTARTLVARLQTVRNIIAGKCLRLIFRYDLLLTESNFGLKCYNCSSVSDAEFGAERITDDEQSVIFHTEASSGCHVPTTLERPVVPTTPMSHTLS